MSEGPVGWCAAARSRFAVPSDVQCCMSCHEDFDMGYSDFLEARDPEGGYYLICCALSIAIDGDL